MSFQYVPVIWVEIAASMITLFLGIYAMLRRRDAKGASTFAFTMILASFWCIFNALVISGADVYTKSFWLSLLYIPCGFVPVLLLSLCMQFTGYDDWVDNKRVWWLLVLPVIFFLIKCTDYKYGLIMSGMHLDYSGPYAVLDRKLGTVFYIDLVYTYLITLSSLLLLVRTLFLKNTIFRRQSLSLLLTLIITWVLHIITFFVIIGPDFDYTSVAFAPGGLIMAWGFFRFKLFDLVPVARATVFETMDVGVMVLDLQGRVIDINPAFRNILGLPLAKQTGRKIDEVCLLPDLLAACLNQDCAEVEISSNHGDLSSDYQILLSPLDDNRGQLIGRLVIAYDITQKKQAQEYYLQQQWRMAIIEEQERIGRDLHDNLGQLLAFINLQAQGVRQEFINAGIEIASDNLDKLVDVTQAAHKEVREYIQNARNLALVEKDFISALIHELQAFNELAGINVITDIPPGFAGREFLPNMKMNTLNIIKEALNNVHKHAVASNVKIRISYDQEALYITIEDDGQGFDIIQYHSNSPGHFGLFIMQERANEIGAQIDIKSSPGRGTRIAFRVPVNRMVVNPLQAFNN